MYCHELVPKEKVHVHAYRMTAVAHSLLFFTYQGTIIPQFTIL